jgi:hypothetical protein
MKVYIGAYKNYLGPYQLAEKLCFWSKKVPNEFGWNDYPEYVHNFGEWLSNTPITKLLQWIDSKRSRAVHVKIDKYDTWSMDHTLSYIILPMLKQLKETKHGVPLIDDVDVLELLHKKVSTVDETDSEAEYKRNEIVWNFVLDEMIWSFEQKTIDWEHQYYTEKETETLDEVLGKFDLDMTGYTEHMNRMNRGFMYFGRYYQALWD